MKHDAAWAFEAKPLLEPKGSLQPVESAGNIVVEHEWNCCVIPAGRDSHGLHGSDFGHR